MLLTQKHKDTYNVLCKIYASGIKKIREGKICLIVSMCHHSADG